MLWPMLGFTVGFIIAAVFMAAAGFHVFRYRYRNDASLPAFILACALFFLITIFIYIEFDWGTGVTPPPSIIIDNNTL